MKVLRDKKTDVLFLELPAGDFSMGAIADDTDERPIHQVRITKPFLLGKYPVTNQEYERFLKASPDTQLPLRWLDTKFNRPGQPVVGVSWDDAQAYCRWAGCRLPTEAEWEYACRAGSGGQYCFGDDEAKLEEYAWYRKNNRDTTEPVGMRLSNAWGLCDMHGNVWEWCQDWCGAYPEGPVTDPTGPEKGTKHAIRGGCYRDTAKYCRSACRGGLSPDVRLWFLGFRVVLADTPGTKA